jgi:hypothetical protein
MAAMRPESFARWSPQAQRHYADFIIRMGTEGDVEACVRLVVAKTQQFYRADLSGPADP